MQTGTTSISGVILLVLEPAEDHLDGFGTDRIEAAIEPMETAWEWTILSHGHCARKPCNCDKACESKL